MSLMPPHHTFQIYFHFPHLSHFLRTPNRHTHTHTNQLGIPRTHAHLHIQDYAKLLPLCASLLPSKQIPTDRSIFLTAIIHQKFPFGCSDSTYNSKCLKPNCLSSFSSTHSIYKPIRNNENCLSSICNHCIC